MTFTFNKRLVIGYYFTAKKSIGHLFLLLIEVQSRVFKIGYI